MRAYLFLYLMLVMLVSACGTDPPEPELRQFPTAVILTTATPSIIYTAPTEPSIPATLLPTSTISATPTRTPPPESTLQLPASPTATATEVRYVYIAIAVKQIPAGFAIPSEAVVIYPWPADAVPFSAITIADDVVNKVALADIHCFEPFVETVLVLREVGTGFENLESCPVLPPQTGEVTLVNVVVATQFVDAGMTIRPGMVAMRQWPADIRPLGTIRRFADVIGKETQADLIPEQPILIGALAEP